MASQVNYLNSVQSSCFQNMIRSKWTDAALITSGVALLIIGIVASTGGFNCIGTTNAAYLSYGMYVGASLLFLAEIIKILMGCGGCVREIDIENLNSDESLNEAIREVEIDSRCMKTLPCKHGCKITLADGRSIKTGLSGGRAYLFLHAIDENKIIYGSKRGFPEGHFFSADVFEDNETTGWEVFKNMLRGA